MSKNKAYTTLKYSIRLCNEEEIEIRNDFFDGYPRGFIRFPISNRKKINQAIAEQKVFWNDLSYKQQMQRYDKAVKEQQELNEQLA